MQDARAARRLSPAWGLVAIAFYATHAGYFLLHRHPEHLLWACHLGTMLVGIGFIYRSATTNAIGFLWLLMGNTLWLIDLVTGGEFLPTSLLTHVGGLMLSLLGLKAFGMPRHVWWQAVLAFSALQELCRWMTPPAANVNLAFAVWAGWESSFPSYVWFVVMLNVVGLTAGFGAELITHRVITRR